MLFALNKKLERESVEKNNPPYFCPICHEELEIKTLVRKRQHLEKYDIYNPDILYLIHTQNTDCEYEPENEIHILMKKELKYTER